MLPGEVAEGAEEIVIDEEKEKSLYLLEYDVYNVGSGILIGRIYYLKKRFILGGRCWETAQIVEKEKKVYATFIGNAPVVAKVFEGKGAGNYNYLLAPVLKKRINKLFAYLRICIEFASLASLV